MWLMYSCITSLIVSTISTLRVTRNTRSSESPGSWAAISSAIVLCARRYSVLSIAKPICELEASLPIARNSRGSARSWRSPIIRSSGKSRSPSALNSAGGYCWPSISWQASQRPRRRPSVASAVRP